MKKEFVSVVKLEIGGNNFEAKSKEEYVELVKEQFTLDLPEEIPEFSGENNPLNHFKKLTIVPDNETD